MIAREGSKKIVNFMTPRARVLMLEMQYFFSSSCLHYWFLFLPWLLERSKKCRGHYSTIYHASSQLIIKCDTHLSFWHLWNQCIWSSKTMSITCRFRFRCGVGLVYLVLACKKSKSGEALLFKVNLSVKTYCW